MTHVVIRSQGPAAVLTIDGIDLSKHAMRKGFRVEFTDDGPLVHVTFCARTLDADLPEAVVSAIRNEHDDEVTPLAERLSLSLRNLADIRAQLRVILAEQEKNNVALDDIAAGSVAREVVR